MYFFSLSTLKKEIAPAEEVVFFTADAKVWRIKKTNIKWRTK